MPWGIASSNQLGMMAKVLAAYCEINQLNHEGERDRAANAILQLFHAGFRDEETLLAELIRRRSQAA
jgi:hypothetical protein